MREFTIGQASETTESQKSLTLVYQILVHEIGGAVPLESYGIRISVPETGEYDEVRDLTVSAARIEELGKLLQRNSVTPCALSDVIADWL